MTDDSPIPLARPVLGEEEEAGVLDVLRSGRLSLGPRVPEFETAFAGWLGAAHASAVSSGTAGLHLALRAVGVSDGAEVVTSPFSFVASANVMVYERARPVFADIDPVTLNLDPDAAAAAVTERTAAVWTDERRRTATASIESVITTPWLRLFRAELMNALRRNCECLTLRNADITQSATAARNEKTTMPPISNSQMKCGSIEPI